MRVFKDAISGDEMFSDSHSPQLINDVVYEVDANFITVSNGLDSKLIAANPSGEEGQEEVSDSTERVIDLVHASRLVSTSFDKKSYRAYLKGYLKAIKERLQKENPERVSIFESRINEYMVNVFKNFDDYEHYIGESMNPDGMVALMNFRENGVTPYFVFLKDGLIEEKY